MDSGRRKTSVCTNILNKQEVKLAMKKFFQEEDGQGMVEYVLIVVLVAAAVVATVRIFGDKILALFRSSNEKIQTSTAGR
jgi:pilus assembly protein Flp/PilA